MFQSYHAELHQYKHHIELFNQLTQKLIAVYQQDDTTKVKKMTETINQRYNNLNTRWEVVIFTLYNKNFINFLFYLPAPDICLESCNPLDLQFFLLPLPVCLHETTLKLLSKFYETLLIPFSFDLNQGGILTATLYKDMSMFLHTSEVENTNICQNEKCMNRSC